jgi:hypothetical protein
VPTSPANAPVLGVVDLGEFEVEIKVPESFAATCAIGMPAQITSGARTVCGQGARGVAGSASTAKSTRACASTASSRPACARTSA